MDKATEVEWWAKVGEKFLIQILVLSVILILRFHWILFLKLPGRYQMLSCVWLFETPWTVACQSPLSMGILQARILEWVAMPSSRGSSQPMAWIKPRSPALQADSLASEPPGKPKNTGVGSLSLLQGIFLTQELNQGLIHCRQIFFFFNQISYQGKPRILERGVSPPGYLPDPWIKPTSLTSPALTGRFFSTGATWEAP